MSNNYSKAYTEVLEILEHLPREEYSKIPVNKIKFYEKNMDKNYIFTINPNISLTKQNISKEANCIILSLFKNYFASDKQKIVLHKFLKANSQKNEYRKKGIFYY